jgi:hypothetical protein
MSWCAMSPSSHLGVAICKLSRVNPRVSVNDVLDKLSDCYPSIAQDIVFQG